MAKSPEKTEMAADRTPREMDSRESEVREVSWEKPSMLPMPKPREGVSFRYIRTSTIGKEDNTNVSSKFREGWTPVLAADHPELQVQSDYNSRFSENIEIGGLLLCQNATENVEARSKYQKNQTKRQIDAVENNFLRESDPRMPVLSSERRTSFGD